MRELSAKELPNEVGKGRPSLVSCLSFEDRSLAVAEALAPCGIGRWLCFVNDDVETDISDIRNRAIYVADRSRVKIEFIPASKHNPLVLADSLFEISKTTTADSTQAWIADITTMTHEMLLMTLAAAEDIIPAWDDLLLLYNVAGRYSGKDEPEHKWTSRGIRSLRSVVGYAGALSPGEHTTLIALPGFDSDRMGLMVEEIEPDTLIVGIACSQGKHHDWSSDKNRKIADRLLENRRGSVFEYSALDPYSAVDAVINATRKIGGNIIVAPLNSKISTVAVGELARQLPEWQVSYAPALIYNIGYATPSDSFLSCTLKELQAYVTKSLKASTDAV